jgi:zinc transporter 1
MLSDGLCLVVALVALKVAKRSNNEQVMKADNTFGWARAEIIGGLTNAIFLLALCVIIILESIEKFIQPQPVEQPLTVCIVGAVGLIMNLIGLVLFRGGGEMHGHSHSRDGDEHSHNDYLDHGHGHSHEPSHGHSHAQDKSGEGMNMRGVFLHVLGDAVGSVVVILSAGLMYFYNNCDEDYLSKCRLHKTAIECGGFLQHNSNLSLSQLQFALSENVLLNNKTLQIMFPATKYHWTL